MVALSAAVAAFFAFRGIQAWRRELRGKSQYALAKEILKSVYEVREGFKRVRQQVIFQYEYPESMVDYHGHLLPEKEYDGMVYVYQQRLNVLEEAFHTLEQKHLDSQVEWGTHLHDMIIPLRECRAELRSSISFRLKSIKNRSEAERLTGNQKDEYVKMTNEMAAIMTAKTSGETFTKKINDALEKFEYFRKYI